MTAINLVTDLSVENGVAVVTVDSPPVNALTVDVRNGLRDAFAKLLGDAAVQAIVLICEIGRAHV